MHKVILSGHLGQKATVHQGKKGDVCNLNLATSESIYKGKDENGKSIIEDHTEWHRITVLGTRGSFDWLMNNEKLDSGCPVEVMGVLRKEEPYVKENMTYNNYHILVERDELVARGKPRPATDGASNQNTDNANKAPAQNNQPEPAKDPVPESVVEGSDGDDIPF